MSATWEEHLVHIEEVMKWLKDAGLTVRAQKCQFGGKEVTYLRHKIGNGKIKPLETKVVSIREWPVPSTKKEVQSFLGLL